MPLTSSALPWQLSNMLETVLHVSLQVWTDIAQRISEALTNLEKASPPNWDQTSKGGGGGGEDKNRETVMP